MSGNTRPHYGLAILTDDDGKLQCDPPHDCSVCSLFDHQRPGESRAAWLARITRYGLKRYQLEASA